MALDDNLMQQLLQVFEVELAEQVQVITSGVLELENPEISEKPENLDNILRAAHTIKGAAKGIGQEDIVNVTHRLESILTALGKGKIKKSSELFNLILETLDRMLDIFNSQRLQQAYLFDYPQLLDNLDFCINNFAVNSLQKTSNTSKSRAIVNRLKLKSKKTDQAIDSIKTSEIETYSITNDEMNSLSIIAEDLQITKLQVKHLLDDLHQISSKVSQLSSQLGAHAMDQSLTENNTIHDTAVELSQLSHHIINQFNSRRSFSGHFNQLVDRLDDSVNSLRLVSFSVLAMPLQRIVRDMAQQQNKQIKLDIKDNDIKIDRHLYKIIHAPLIHLINNAIDHGIETPEQRQQNKKNETGSISVSVFEKDRQLFIRISDDGKGLDAKKIKQQAVRLGLITEKTSLNMSQEQCLEFIFHPGFSLAKKLTTSSGRGVGLDIVRNNLRKIKGSVNVTSTPKVGTEFILQFPARISSEQGLLVMTCGQTYVIPSYGIDWVKTHTFDSLNMVNEKPFLADKNNELVSAYYLSELLTLKGSTQTSKSALPTIYLTDGVHKIAIIIDDIIDDQEFVIRQYQYPLINVPYSIGVATIVYGQLVPVLSVDEILERALSFKNSSKFPVITESKVKQNKVIVVDDSITTRTLLTNILKRQGYNVSSFTNGFQAWQELTQHSHYDLLITDVEMPLMNGFELVEKVKNHEATQLIPTIIVTSLNSEQDKKRGLKVGADAYITKDLLDTESLLTIIGQLI